MLVKSGCVLPFSGGLTLLGVVIPDRVCAGLIGQLCNSVTPGFLFYLHVFMKVRVDSCLLANSVC